MEASQSSWLVTTQRVISNEELSPLPDKPPRTETKIIKKLRKNSLPEIPSRLSMHPAGPAGSATQPVEKKGWVNWHHLRRLRWPG